ncbi:MAG: hypothetical protein LC808_41410 [Actinobacteria bacterium]|nr:hypothetical protein [Actinomycetota bacterium]
MTLIGEARVRLVETVTTVLVQPMILGDLGGAGNRSAALVDGACSRGGPAGWRG